jgi:hypothetical protein
MIIQTWYQRGGMTLGRHGSLYRALDAISGDCVFGKNNGKTKIAYDLLLKYMEKSENMQCFQTITEGNIILTPPSHEYMVTKLKEYINRAKEYYKNKNFTIVTDIWAGGNIHEGQPLNKNIQYHSIKLERKEKRFKGVIATVSEQIIDLITSSNGMLCEGHVIAFLNTCYTCPECKNVGEIGWCDGISHRSVDCFRDAICMSCYKKGIKTLFEIKTRWESAIQKNKDPGTYAGSYAAINSLMMIKTNVYIVIASRDTGNIRVGKITSAKLRGNKNWLYSLQEGFDWGSPSSYISCEKGLTLLPAKMPPLMNVDKNIKSIIQEVLTYEKNF